MEQLEHLLRLRKLGVRPDYYLMDCFWYAADRGLLAAVNPSQQVTTVELPLLSGAARVLFADRGFEPVLDGNRLTLGPEQMAVVATGSLAVAENDLGRSDELAIPSSITPAQDSWAQPDPKQAVLTIAPRPGHRLRLIVRQLAGNGRPHRSTGGAPPKGRTLGEILPLAAEQGGTKIDIQTHYDKPIWSGLSWSVGEIDCDRLPSSGVLTITARTTDPAATRIEPSAYWVRG